MTKTEAIAVQKATMSFIATLAVSSPHNIKLTINMPSNKKKVSEYLYITEFLTVCGIINPIIKILQNR